MKHLTEEQSNDRIGWVELELLFSQKPIDQMKEAYLQEYPGEEQIFDEIINILVD